VFTRIFIQSIHLHLFTSKPLSNLQEILLMKNTGKPVLQLPMFTNNSNCLSTFLILFSYLTNQWLIGIMVLLCHDISDLFLIIARGYKVFYQNILGLSKLF